MKLVIIPDDGLVQIDDENFIVDTIGAPKDIHALQWNNGATLEPGDDKGEIEYKTNEDGVKLENKIITKLPKWTDKYIKGWETAKKKPIVVEIDLDDIPEPMIPKVFDEIYTNDDIKE